MKTMKIFLTIVVALFTISSCEPEQGEIGPTGEIGPIGPTGATGAIETIDIYNKNWTVEKNHWVEIGTKGIDLTYQISLNVPEITNEVLNNGVVLVYFYYLNGFYPLPYIGIYPTRILLINYKVKLNHVVIYIADSEYNSGIFNGDATFKVVVINPIII